MNNSDFLNRFSRVTLSQQFIPEIDGLRFFAIVSVVLFHLRTSVLRIGEYDESTLKANSVLFEVLSNGGYGVNVFFVISGFILALPMVRAYLQKEGKFNLKKFYLRRITRLEPPYIIIMSGIFFLEIFFLNWDFCINLSHYLASISYVHYFIYDAWSTINPVAWSLETEVQFYLLAPFFAHIFLISNNVIRRVLCTGIIAAHVFLTSHWNEAIDSYHLSKSIVSYFSSFFTGYLIADFFALSTIVGEHAKPPKSFLFDIVGLIGMSGIFYFYQKYNPSYLFFLVSVFFLFLGVFKGKYLNIFSTSKMITVIGGMCYSIYLIHYVFLFMIVSQLSNWFYKQNFFCSYLIACMVVLPLLLIVSSVTFLLLEKPFMYASWPRQLKEKIKQLNIYAR